MALSYSRLATPDIAAAVVRLGEPGFESDGLVVLGHCLAERLLVEPDVAAAVVSRRALGVESDGLVVVAIALSNFCGRTRRCRG